MSNMRLVQPSVVRDNCLHWLSQEGDIACGIHQHDPISSQDLLCQDSSLGTVQVQKCSAMPHQYFWRRLGEVRLTQLESRQVFLSCGRILFHITNRKTQWPDREFTWNICWVSLVGYVDEGHNHHSCKNLIPCSPPPIACVHLAEYLVTLQLGKAYLFTIALHLR